MMISDKLAIDEEQTKPWIDFPIESVNTGDDKDIDDIEAINKQSAVAKRGFVHVYHYYNITSAGKIVGRNGTTLKPEMTEEKAKQQYQYDDTVPDMPRYFIKNHENLCRYYQVYPPVGWPPIGYAAVPPYDVPTISPVEQPLVYRCDLCVSTLGEGNALSKHASTNNNN